MYKKTVLDNGVRVVTCHMPNMRSASFGLWFGVGGRFETKKNNGISHFLEHMCFKGSKRFSGEQIKQLIEGVGGSLNAFTAEEFTCYLAKVLPKYLEQSFEIISDMAVNPLVDKKELEKERFVILEEIRMYRDQPQSYVYELLDELLWPGHPLGMNLAGTFDTVKKIKQEDILSFNNKFYSSPNIVAVASGNVSHEEFLNICTRHLSRLSKGSKNSFSAFNQQSKKSFNLFFKNTEQSHIALGFEALRRGHPDRHALMLIHIILGANMSSRLFDELREKRGLAYAISSHLKQLADTGAFIVHAGVDNNKLCQALEIIFKELNKIKSEYVSDSEFQRAKDFYLGQLTFALEQTMEEMFYMGEQTISLDKVRTHAEIIRELEKVDVDDIKRLAGKIFSDEKINLAVIGPVSDKDKSGIKKKCLL